MLELNGLCKRFGGKTVADNICLTVGRGKILAVLGRSGCGKSTLLNMIAGIVRPDGGEIWLNGENITRMPPEKRRISLMFQDYALFPHMSALENAAFGLKMQKMPKAEAERLAMAALAEVGLENEAHRKPEKLSGGEKQRLALARFGCPPFPAAVGRIVFQFGHAFARPAAPHDCRTYPQGRHPCRFGDAFARRGLHGGGRNRRHARGENPSMRYARNLGSNACRRAGRPTDGFAQYRR